MYAVELRRALEKMQDGDIVLVETPRAEPVGPGKVSITGIVIVIEIGDPCTLILKVEEQ